MTIPPALEIHIQQALAIMRGNPDSILPLDARLPIYHFFDSLPGMKGRIARTHLAIRVAQKVLPLIEQPNWGYSTMPDVMCASAEQVLAHLRRGMTAQQINRLAQKTTIEALLGQTVVDSLVMRKDQPIYRYPVENLLRLAEEMDSLTGTPASSLYYLAYCVHLAAMNALEEALAWNWWTQADGAEWAVIAYAGGVWTAFEDPERRDDELGPNGTWDYSAPDVQVKRCAFWEWWFNEAIPSAWETLRNSHI
jgi:hypothetical protein